MRLLTLISSQWKRLLFATTILLLIILYSKNQLLSRAIRESQTIKQLNYVNRSQSVQVNVNKRTLKICPLNKLLQLDWDSFLDDVLFRKQLFLNYNVSAYTPDLQGWTNLDKLFEQQLDHYLKQNAKLEVVRLVEVGAWKGRSTVAMAGVCRRLTADKRKKCTLLSIDTWAGSVEHFLPGLMKMTQRMMRSTGGIFRLFDVFLQNVKKMNLDDVVVPLRLPSTSAAQLLHCYQLRADMVFIDAAHEYDAVQEDMAYFYGIVKDDGILFGDDYGWLSVRNAVNDFARLNNLSVIVSDFKTWTIHKRKQ